MRFLADECCDGDLVAALRTDGHDVEFVPEFMPGSVDEVILSHAYQTNRVVLTEDKDFGELVYRLRLPACGVVLIRFDTADRLQKIPRCRALTQRYGERLNGVFVTLEVDKTRARPLQRDHCEEERI